MRTRLIVIIVTLFVFPCFANPIVPVSQSYGLVNDHHSVLTIKQKHELTLKLSELENHNGIQIILLIIPDTLSEGIERYSMRVMETWP